MAHLLGVRGATRLVQLKQARPGQIAQKAFPRAANANRSLFFGVSRLGKANALSIAELHGRVDAMMDQRLARYAALR
jgi:hypothetical protein